MFDDTRTNVAADHVSGDALPAALPFSKPIDAHSGWVPNGDAGNGSFSHACSGISPIPDAIADIDCHNSTASRPLPVAISCSARSPASTGQRWPDPLFWPCFTGQSPGHGLPCTLQSVGSPTLQSP